MRMAIQVEQLEMVVRIGREQTEAQSSPDSLVAFVQMRNP